METSNSFGKNSCSGENILDKFNSGQVRWSELDPASRDALVQTFTQKVKIIAWRLKAKLPEHVDVNDLYSAGSLGLLECLGKFDPGMGVKLETYVENRIRGAMLDELRRQDWLSRGMRYNIRLIEQAKANCEQDTGEPPSEEELQKATGLNAKEVEQALDALEKQVWLSLDYMESHNTPSSGEEDGESEPYSATLQNEMVDKMSEFIQELTRREQLVLSLYYEQELTMKETSQVLEITEGRVSQLHNQALQKLRSRFKQETDSDT
ncbi:MAG: FliA/WhiG family RNA polymerase sigma factor [Thermodesulfobacteriota bacterium]